MCVCVCVCINLTKQNPNRNIFNINIVLCTVFAFKTDVLYKISPQGWKTFSLCLDGCLSMWEFGQLLSPAVLCKILHWEVIIPSALEEMIIEKRQHYFRIPEHGEVSVSDSRLTSRLFTQMKESLEQHMDRYNPCSRSHHSACIISSYFAWFHPPLHGY